MKSNKIRLGEQCVVTSSKRFHLSERITQGVPFYCSKEIIKKFNGEDVTECDYISEDLYKKVSNEFGVPKENDLLITTRGTIGIPYLYKRTDRFYFADGNLTWIKDFDSNLYSKFLYYWFQSYEGRKKFEALAKGTAQKAVPISGIKTLEIELPSLKDQKRIVDILSAYDDLIENNQKQIKLLEEAAQRLYKEWFVDLPFHQGVGSYGVRFVMDDIYSTSYTRIAEPNSILFSVRAPVGRLNITKNKVVIGRGLAAINQADGCQSYLYYLLKNKFFKDNIVGNGSIFASVSKDELLNQKFLIPERNLMMQFEKIVSQMDKQIENLDSKNKKLIEARDRLLPKLMSGEVEV